jgi:hypothetical protein
MYDLLSWWPFGKWWENYLNFWNSAYKAHPFIPTTEVKSNAKFKIRCPACGIGVAEDSMVLDWLNFANIKDGPKSITANCKDCGINLSGIITKIPKTTL